MMPVAERAVVDNATITMPMSRDEAIEITREIRGHLSDAREKILKVHRTEAYKLLGYDSFKDWAIGEFEISWQQVYNLKTAAEIDETILPLVSPTGEPYNIPVNQARALRKLKTPEAQVEAYQMSLDLAAAQGEKFPTETIIKNSVATIQAKTSVKESPFPVVKQMLADTGITVTEGKSIVDELNKLEDYSAQVYVQKLMARYGLKNPDLIYPLGHKFKTERKKGKESYVLDELENTKGRLAGTPLAKATDKDLKRANDEARNQHIAEAEEKKRQAEEAERQRQLELHNLDPENNPPPPPVPVQVAMTVWQHDPEKTLNNLERELSDKDLDALLMLMAQRRGWTFTQATLTGDPYPTKPIPETGEFLAVNVFPRNGLECHEADELAMLIRVKPVEEDEGH